MGKEDVVYTNTLEYYPAVKKNEIMPFAATRMGLEIIILSEVNQKQKYKSILYDIACGI